MANGKSLKPGWFEDDLERASRRVQEWKIGSSTNSTVDEGLNTPDEDSKNRETVRRVA